VDWLCRPAFEPTATTRLVYYIPGEGGGLLFAFSGRKSAASFSAAVDIILPYPVVVTAFVVAWAIFLLHTGRSSDDLHLRHRRQHGRRGAQRHSGRSPHHFDLHPVGRDIWDRGAFLSTPAILRLARR